MLLVILPEHLLLLLSHPLFITMMVFMGIFSMLTTTSWTFAVISSWQTIGYGFQALTPSGNEADHFCVPTIVPEKFIRTSSRQQVQVTALPPPPVEQHHWL